MDVYEEEEEGQDDEDVNMAYAQDNSVGGEEVFEYEGGEEDELRIDNHPYSFQDVENVPMFCRFCTSLHYIHKDVYITIPSTTTITCREAYYLYGSTLYNTLCPGDEHNDVLSYIKINNTDDGNSLFRCLSYHLFDGEEFEHEFLRTSAVK